jgi:hypothetical protein
MALPELNDLNAAWIDYLFAFIGRGRPEVIYGRSEGINEDVDLSPDRQQRRLLLPWSR